MARLNILCCPLLLTLAMIAAGCAPQPDADITESSANRNESTSALDTSTDGDGDADVAVADGSADMASPKPAAQQADTPQEAASRVERPAATEQAQDLGVGLLEPYEIKSESLLAAALPPDQLEEGWVRLFDGHSPFGWFLTGQANWSVKDGAVRVSQGERSFLCTSFQLPDYEFKVDFRSDPNTNSGIFLRTGPEPDDVSTGCLELNIAPPDNPFPTGSFVQRKKLEPADLNAASEGGEFDPTQWHTYHVRLIGSTVEVFLDGKSVMQLNDFPSNPTGHISLQFNEGFVEFRNMLLRPVEASELKLDEDWQADWDKSVSDGASMNVEAVDDGLKLKGGLGQLQSKQDFGDFVLQASYTLARPEVNSGIFFRCIRDNMLDGYECQINHAVEEGDPLRPGDAGAGAIFRRQPARIVVGDGTEKSFVTILANGPQIITWVNGLQVVDFYDSREPNENPRRGLRTEPGPVAIQAHDADTEVTYHELRVSKL